MAVDEDAMGIEIDGVIEEMHEDEEGVCIIDKVNLTHISLVPEDEMKDAMEICGWDELSDEALAKFEKLVEESESGVPSLATVDPNLVDYMEYPAHRDEWKDWLMGR